MKNRFSSIYVALVLCMLFLFQSCEAIGDIFKAGVWVGILIVVVIIGIVIFIISKVAK